MFLELLSGLEANGHGAARAYHQIMLLSTTVWPHPKSLWRMAPGPANHRHCPGTVWEAAGRQWKTSAQQYSLFHSLHDADGATGDHTPALAGVPSHDAHMERVMLKVGWGECYSCSSQGKIHPQMDPFCTSLWVNL